MNHTLAPTTNPSPVYDAVKRSDYERKLTAKSCIDVSNSRNAVNFSSARTTNRFPSSRCASAIQIVRPTESMAGRQPQLPSGFAEIVSDGFRVLHITLPLRSL
jgi:hypothetical protein